MDRQSLYWGLALVEENVLIDHLTEVVDRTIANFDSPSPERPVSADAPLYVCGSPISHASIMPGMEKERFIRSQLCLNRRAVELACRLDAPEGFPTQDLMVSVGMNLREV